MNGLAADPIQRLFGEAPMSKAQVRVVTLTAILSALDGYDVLSVTFAAPAISQEWGIGRAALGIVLSAGLAGMAAGSFLLGPLADRWGRRTLIFISLALMSVGMAMSALSRSIELLSFWRVVTGLGIGACVVVINPLAAEFANDRRRPLVIAMMAMGYPLGGVAGGLIAAALLRFFGWQAVFLAGCAFALLLMPFAYAYLLESPAFLATRRPLHALERLNAVLTRCTRPTLTELPHAAASQRHGYAGLFRDTPRRVTIGLSAANFLYAAAAYYVLSWLPQMVADAGYSVAAGSIVSATASLVGVVGGLVCGWLAMRVPALWLTVSAAIGLGFALLVFGQLTLDWTALMLASAMLGLFLFAGVSGFYYTLAQSFAAGVRAAGVGFVMGIGRIASAIAPLLAGWLFAAGAGRAAVSAVFACLAAGSGICLVIAAIHRGKISGPS